MIIKYKEYVGTIFYMQQIEGAKYRIILTNSDNIKLDIICDIHEIELVNCVANNFILDKLNLK